MNSFSKRTMLNPTFTSPSKNNFRVSLLTLRFIVISSLVYVFFKLHFTPPPAKSFSFPLPLSKTLQSFIRPNILLMNDWKRPLVLTALARPANEFNVFLIIFTTGVITKGFGRKLNVVGCLVGESDFPVKAWKTGLIVCRIPAHHLRPGTPISVLLQKDQLLTESLRGELRFGDEVFKLQPGDVKPVNSNFSQDVQQLLGGQPAMKVRSNVMWSESLFQTSNPDVQRHELCLMTAMRQYPYLLPDFFEYYRRLGVDKFYVYDNMAVEDLRKYETNDVEVVYWPWSRSQTQSFSHFLIAGRTRCRYTAFFDADEYVMVGGDGKDLLKRYVRNRVMQGFKQIIFPFIMMLNSEYIRTPNGSLPELYTRRENVQQNYKVGKAIVDMDCEWRRHKIHFVKGSYPTYHNYSMELKPESLQHNSRIVHYTKRSWEEYTMKHATGGSSAISPHQPVKILDVQSPNIVYMDLSYSTEYTVFRDKWRRIMGRHR